MNKKSSKEEAIKVLSKAFDDQIKELTGDAQKKGKLLGDLAKVYDEIYDLERQHVAITKKKKLKQARLDAILNTIRLDYGNKR